MSIMYDVIIIGAGPAGLSAGLRAKEEGLNYLIFEKSRVANTIANYPDGKPVLDQPKDVKILGSLPFVEESRENVLKSWDNVANSLDIRFEEVTDVKENGFTYIVETAESREETKYVILAIGVQGTPKKIGVEGEEKAKYAFEKVKPCDVVIVGGGDVAVESALELSKTCKVTLSYRKPEFFRVKPENMERLKSSDVKVVLESSVRKVDEGHVHLETKEGEKQVNADEVFIFAGTVTPIEFLTKLGMKIEDNRPVYNEHYEVKPNFFVAGDLTKEPLIKNAINHGYEIVEEIIQREKKLR